MGVAINNIYYLLYIYFIYIIFIPNINIYIPFGMGYLDQDLLQNIQIKLLKGLHFFFLFQLSLLALFCYVKCCQKQAIVCPLTISGGQSYLKLYKQVEGHVTLFISKKNSFVWSLETVHTSIFYYHAFIGRSISMLLAGRLALIIYES